MIYPCNDLKAAALLFEAKLNERRLQGSNLDQLRLVERDPLSEQEVALKVVEIPCPDCKAESLRLIRLERGVHFVCRGCDGVYDLTTRGIAAVFH